MDLKEEIEEDINKNQTVLDMDLKLIEYKNDSNKVESC